MRGASNPDQAMLGRAFSRRGVNPVRRRQPSRCEKREGDDKGNPKLPTRHVLHGAVSEAVVEDVFVEIAGVVISASSPGFCR